MYKTFLFGGSGAVNVADGRMTKVCVRLDRGDDGSITMSVTVAGQQFMDPLPVHGDTTWPRQGVLGFCHYGHATAVKIHGFKWAASSNM